ncbi:MAG: hypothetical protein GY939_09140 [Actinomycetia bacterium]|nr:hypothetical protein [Actinomycetes bacterium]
MVDEFVVEMVCRDGHINEVSVPHSTLGPLDFSPIDDVVNGIDACEGSGGLASIQFMGCDIDPFLIEIDAIDGGIPDFRDYDMCETTMITSDEFVVDMVCRDGHVLEASLPAHPAMVERIDDMVNESNPCAEGFGGLSSVQFMVCGPNQRLVEIPAVDERIPDISDYDLCVFGHGH